MAMANNLVGQEGNITQAKAVSRQSPNLPWQKGSLPAPTRPAQLASPGTAQPSPSHIAQPSPQPATQLSSAPVRNPASTVGKTGIVQRIIDIEDSVEAADTDIIETVLNTNPILRALWDWLTNHGRYTFTVRRANNGFNKINARLGDIAISFSINPLIYEGAQQVRDDVRWISTISHELTLHLLPWARVMMLHELKGDLVYSELDNEEQVGRMAVVLGPIAGDVPTLIKHINADKANKLTTSAGGNHSDILLWNQHLRDMLNVVASQPDTEVKGAIIAHTLEKMRLPITATGKLSDAVDRGPGALATFNQTMLLVAALKAHVADDDKQRFDDNIAFINARMRKFDFFLQVKRRIVALYPDQEINMHLLNYAVEKGTDLDNAVFLYQDITDSMG